MCNAVNHIFKCKHVYPQLVPCSPSPCPSPSSTVQVQSPSPCAVCAPAYAKWTDASKARMQREQEEERILGEKYRGLFEVSV